MVKKQFKELAVGDQFTLNGLQYQRIADVRVSCCKVFNAVNITDEKNQIQVTPLTEVEING